jgi:hypothetical protein
LIFIYLFSNRPYRWRAASTQPGNTAQQRIAGGETLSAINLLELMKLENRSWPVDFACALMQQYA